ncbi:MAG TPA: 50S ribosomal protein L25/general stress protein Ctc [Polyangia bacterium]|nr:50S ribosomal protein L25/general stress protein Ctc [Polyangia bacterium]
MDFAKVSVEVRNESGKGSSRRARRAGKVPGILYGHKEAPVTITIDPHALVKSLDKERKRNTVFDLSVGTDKSITAMIRDVQLDPLSRRIIHVDFIRVSMDEEVKVTVPLHLVGNPVGVVNGGNLHQGMHAVPLAAKPDAIPTKLELNVSALEIGQALHASDLKLGAGVRVLLDPKAALASVVLPRAEKTEEAAAAAPAEGAAAAPAEGAAAPAAGAAAPAAAGGDKAAAGAKKEEKGGEKKTK